MSRSYRRKLPINVPVRPAHYIGRYQLDGRRKGPDGKKSDLLSRFAEARIRSYEFTSGSPPGGTFIRSGSGVVFLSLKTAAVYGQARFTPAGGKGIGCRFSITSPPFPARPGLDNALFMKPLVLCVVAVVHLRDFCLRHLPGPVQLPGAAVSRAHSDDKRG